MPVETKDDFTEESEDDVDGHITDDHAHLEDSVGEILHNLYYKGHCQCSLNLVPEICQNDVDSS